MLDKRQKASKVLEKLMDSTTDYIELLGIDALAKPGVQNLLDKVAEYKSQLAYNNQGLKRTLNKEFDWDLKITAVALLYSLCVLQTGFANAFAQFVSKELSEKAYFPYHLQFFSLFST